MRYLSCNRQYALGTRASGIWNNMGKTSGGDHQTLVASDHCHSKQRGLASLFALSSAQHLSPYNRQFGELTEVSGTGSNEA